MRATTARRPSSIFSPSRSRPSNWPTRCCMRCTANRAPQANPPPRPVERTQRLRACVVLVVEDNALNREVAAELLSGEGARGPRRRRAGGRSAGAGGERAVRRGADGHADAGYRWSRGDPENPRRRAPPGCRSGHDRQRLAGRPRSLPGGGHERPCGEADRQGAPGALPARSSRQERRARARRQRQRTRANWSRRGAISSGVSAAAWS